MKTHFLEIAGFLAFEAAGSGLLPQSQRLEVVRNQPSVAGLFSDPHAPQSLSSLSFSLQQESVIPQKRWVAPGAQESSWVRVN